MPRHLFYRIASKCDSSSSQPSARAASINASPCPLPFVGSDLLTIKDSTPQIALFCDEAGKETDRFLAVGGLTVSASNAPIVRRHFIRMCADLGINSEVKWNKLKKRNKEKYQAIAHSFFGLASFNRVQFHCILVDFDRFDHDLRPDGGKNESLKRMYYQLILHRLGKKHGKQANVYAFPDKEEREVLIASSKDAEADIGAGRTALFDRESFKARFRAAHSPLPSGRTKRSASLMFFRLGSRACGMRP